MYQPDYAENLSLSERLRARLGRRSIAIIGTLVLEALIVLAIISLGQTSKLFQPKQQVLTTVDIKEPPPPPPKQPPPPPKEQPKVESPPIVTPPPIVQPPVVTAPPIVTTPNPPPAPIIQAPPSPAPPPPKPSAAVRAKPRGSFQSLMSTDDYPPSALRNNEAGTVGFKLDVGTDGRVTNCTVTSSSGFADLDQTACRLLTKRARFTPAKDAGGAAIGDSFSSRFTWQIPKD